MKRRILKAAALALACMIPSVGFCGLATADGQIPEAAYHAENEYMEIAIAEAREGIYNGDGGPFGSVIVKDGEIIGQGHNMVLANNDSTCHGEISAIRNAEAAIGSYDLTGAELYTTGEPCPMCLAACMWARVDRVVYAADRDDAARGGFDDRTFYELFSTDRASWSTPVLQQRVPGATDPFDAWLTSAARVDY